VLRSTPITEATRDHERTRAELRESSTGRLCVVIVDSSALEVDGVEAIEHRLQRLRRVELLQLIHLDDLLQLRPQALLDVGVVAAAAGLRTLRKQQQW